MDPPAAPDAGTDEIYRFPEFFDRLESQGALNVRDGVESETEIDGIVYHHRGVQVPAHDGVFVWEPPEDDGDPTFSFEPNTVGQRKAWAAFDATREWDLFLRLFDGGAVVAWMSDAEFEAEEADEFDAKMAAVYSGRFSFGAIFQFGPDWVEREEWARRSEAPAMIQFGNGQLVAPDDESGFYEEPRAIPVELRPGDDREPPAHLGLVEAKLESDVESFPYDV